MSLCVDLVSTWCVHCMVCASLGVPCLPPPMHPSGEKMGQGPPDQEWRCCWTLGGRGWNDVPDQPLAKPGGWLISPAARHVPMRLTQLCSPLCTAPPAPYGYKPCSTRSPNSPGFLRDGLWRTGLIAVPLPPLLSSSPCPLLFFLK